MKIFMICTNQIELGIRSMGACLRKAGHDVKIGFFDTFDIFYTNKEINRILQTVRNENPDLILISSIQISRKRTLQLLGRIRNLDVPVICGGIDPTLECDEYLNHSDFVIRGEGETAILEVVKNLASNINIKNLNNICYRDGDKLVCNSLHPLIQHLDNLPFEDYDNYEDYFHLKNGKIINRKDIIEEVKHPLLYKQKKPVFMMTARGCPNACSYCVNASIRTLYKDCKYIRKRSIKSVIDRLRELKKKEDFHKIFFYDDDFFIRNLDEIEEFSLGMKKFINKPFFIFCSPNTINEEKLKLLVDCGLNSLNMGIQSGSADINKIIYNRHISINQIIKATQVINKYIGKGPQNFMPPAYDLIINNPYESKEDVLKSIKVLKHIPKPYRLFIHCLEIFSGTALHEKAIRDNILNGTDENGYLNFHDTLKHLNKRSNHYYLNSILYWMDGLVHDKKYGLISEKMLDRLLNPEFVQFFSRRSVFIQWVNAVLLPKKRRFFIRERIRRFITISTWR
jgi:anaerobic magnesium-protoporphyrin IX monomethyl ester cyclase